MLVDLVVHHGAKYNQIIETLLLMHSNSVLKSKHRVDTHEIQIEQHKLFVDVNIDCNWDRGKYGGDHGLINYLDTWPKFNYCFCAGGVVRTDAR